MLRSETFKVNVQRSLLPDFCLLTQLIVSKVQDIARRCDINALKSEPFQASIQHSLVTFFFLL